MRHAFIAAGPRHDASKLFPPFGVAMNFVCTVAFESRRRAWMFVFSNGMSI
jgi:hypothetical protein